MRGWCPIYSCDHRCDIRGVVGGRAQEEVEFGLHGRERHLCAGRSVEGRDGKDYDSLGVLGGPFSEGSAHRRGNGGTAVKGGKAAGGKHLGQGGEGLVDDPDWGAPWGGRYSG